MRIDSQVRVVTAAVALAFYGVTSLAQTSSAPTSSGSLNAKSAEAATRGNKGTTASSEKSHINVEKTREDPKAQVPTACNASPPPDWCASKTKAELAKMAARERAAKASKLKGN
jgi:hypothetical protein